MPIIVDADAGYGTAINVVRTIRTLERAGAAAVFVEDQVEPWKTDGCTTGLGASADYCPPKLLVACCDRAGIMTKVDVLRMADAEEVVRPIRHRRQNVDRDGLTLGYSRGLQILPPPREVWGKGLQRADPGTLLELDRRQVVGGQDDMIIEVGIELAQGCDTVRS